MFTKRMWQTPNDQFRENSINSFCFQLTWKSCNYFLNNSFQERVCISDFLVGNCVTAQKLSRANNKEHSSAVGYSFILAGFPNIFFPIIRSRMLRYDSIAIFAKSNVTLTLPEPDRHTKYLSTVFEGWNYF